MKTILTSILLLIFCSVHSFSQNTKFNLFVGGEATYLNENEDADLHVTPIYYNKAFQELSYLLGAEIEQNLFDDFDLILKASVGKKYVTNTYSGSFVPVLSYEFLHLYNTIAVRKNINKQLKVGGGVSYNLAKFTLDYFDTHNELTGVIESNYNIKGFNFNLAYTFGLGKEYFFVGTKPSKSFQLTVGYRLFDIDWKKKDKKVDCPTI